MKWRWIYKHVWENFIQFFNRTLKEYLFKVYLGMPALFILLVYVEPNSFSYSISFYMVVVTEDQNVCNLGYPYNSLVWRRILPAILRNYQYLKNLKFLDHSIGYSTPRSNWDRVNVNIKITIGWPLYKWRTCLLIALLIVWKLFNPENLETYITETGFRIVCPCKK